jgi:hypothetical protein
MLKKEMQLKELANPLLISKIELIETIFSDYE